MEVTQDITRLCHVTEMCLRGGADVNAQRQPFNRTPLHDLLSVLNIPLGFDPFWRDNESAEAVSRQQEHFDDALIKCVSVLIEHGSDVNIADSNGKFPLQTLLSNGNHTLRANMCLDSRTCPPVHDAMKKRNYGLENTLSIAKLLIQAGCTTGPNINGSTSLRDLVEMMCSSYFGSDFWAWSHSLEILEVESIFKGYAELIQMLLEYGVDPNKSPTSQLPPLLYLLSHVADSPYTDNYVVPLNTAEALEKLIRILLHYGAKSEIQIETTFGIKTLSCFDMLMPILATLQAHHQHRTHVDLNVLKLLILPLLQYGASSVVFQKILYDVPGASAHAPWCYCVPSHSFFYQFLQFGVRNLQFTCSPYYNDVFEMLYNHTDHLTVQEVLVMISTSLARNHDQDCSCGACDSLRAIILKVIGRPRTLKQLARIAIKAALSNNVAEKVHLLPLPKILVTYMSSFAM